MMIITKNYDNNNDRENHIIGWCSTVLFQVVETKTLCCLCCASGPITAVLHLDKTGFVPGNEIHQGKYKDYIKAVNIKTNQKNIQSYRK